jgi:hypothetical protein
MCGVERAKQVARKAADAYRVRAGVQVGVGSGNAQGSGRDHHSYKNGIKTFQRVSRTIRQTVRFCERCGKDLLSAKHGEWATHHRDHNRENNVRENFELLCKRCHQLEHDCYEALLKVQRPSREGVESSALEAPSPSF